MQPYNEQTPYTVPAPSYGSEPPTYTGNKRDNLATIAMVAGVGVIISSCTGIGGCLLPIFALVAGIMGLRSASQAINPDRTRKYSWIAIATGGFMVVVILGVALLYGGIILAAIGEAQRQAP